MIKCVLQKKQNGNRCSPSTCQLAHFENNYVHLFMMGFLQLNVLWLSCRLLPVCNSDFTD